MGWRIFELGWHLFICMPLKIWRFSSQIICMSYGKLKHLRTGSKFPRHLLFIEEKRRLGSWVVSLVARCIPIHKLLIKLICTPLLMMYTTFLWPQYCWIYWGTMNLIIFNMHFILCKMQKVSLLTLIDCRYCLDNYMIYCEH